MNYMGISHCSVRNGLGVRCVLWVAGCNHHCKGCQNPEAWDENAGEPFTEEVRDKLLEELGQPWIAGLTLSGGDPLYPANRKDIEELVKLVKEKYPEKDIWLWTGYDWDYIKSNSVFSFIFDYVDIVIDGKYIESQRDITLAWRGSSNQQIIDVKVKQGILKSLNGL